MIITAYYRKRGRTLVSEFTSPSVFQRTEKLIKWVKYLTCQNVTWQRETWLMTTPRGYLRACTLFCIDILFALPQRNFKTFAAFFFSIFGLPSTLIHHEDRALWKRSSNQRNLKTPAFRFHVDEKVLRTVLPTTWFLTQAVVCDSYLLYSKTEKSYYLPQNVHSDDILFWFILYARKQLS